MFRIATSASENTRDFKTTKVDAFLASLDIDQHKDVKASFTIKENVHSVLLNKRLTGRFDSLDKTKKELPDLGKFIKDFLAGQILNQVEDEEIAFLFFAFDLELTEDLEGRLAKLETLHGMYELEREQPVAKEWYAYKVILIFRNLFSCTLK